MILAAALAGCAGERNPNPPAQPAAVPQPANAAPAQQWFSREDDTGAWAGFGPPFSEAAFSARCEKASGMLVFNTTEMPPTGPGATVMRLSANGVAQSIPAQASEDGLPNTDAPIDPRAAWLSQMLSPGGDLEVQVGGSDPLTVPISEPLLSLVRDCQRLSA